MPEDIDRENLKKIEAILFISGRFLDIKDFITLSDLNPIIIKELLEELLQEYNKRDSALHIIKKEAAENVEDSETLWKMDVKQEHSQLVNRLAGGNSEFTKAEQGTLALIAFKQPVKQSVIIKIRGNKAYDHIKKFSELGLIKKKRMGHTYELSLSDEFYNYFNIAEGEIKERKE